MPVEGISGNPEPTVDANGAPIAPPPGTAVDTLLAPGWDNAWNNPLVDGFDLPGEWPAGADGVSDQPDPVEEGDGEVEEKTGKDGY